VIDIDSWRADRLDARYDGQPAMPNVAALMARGVTFRNAFAQSGWTMPALVAILTGRYPVAIDVTGASTAVLPSGARLFPEILDLYGYHTAIVWGPGVESGFPVLSRGAAWTRRRAAGIAGEHDTAPYDVWLAQPPAEPFLLVLHELDANVPDAAFLRAHEHDLEAGPACGDANYLATFERLLPTLGDDNAMAHVVRHYDGVLHGYDAMIGALLARLDAAGLLAHTVVVVTSNHGQDFGDHGPGIKHGGLYDVTLRVPLVVAGPGATGGRVVTSPVQGIDLAPTLLDLAGIPADRTMDGRSFAPLLAGADDGPDLTERPLFALTNARNVAIRTRDRKLVLTDEATWAPPTPGAPPPRSPPHLESYDLAADPGEQHDRYPKHPEEAEDLERALRAFEAAHHEGGETMPVDDALRDEIRRTGYWGIAGD
jgi:arylsulfatase A-like enzyme